MQRTAREMEGTRALNPDRYLRILEYAKTLSMEQLSNFMAAINRFVALLQVEALHMSKVYTQGRGR